jgi:cobalamin biosynthesis protein CobT
VTISIFLGRYLQANSRVDRSKVIIEIAQTIHDAGGHFLKENKKGGGWIETSNKEARNKVGHALRDAASAAPLEMKQVGSQEKADPPQNKDEIPGKDEEKADTDDQLEEQEQEKRESKEQRQNEKQLRQNNPQEAAAAPTPKANGDFDSIEAELQDDIQPIPWEPKSSRKRRHVCMFLSPMQNGARRNRSDDISLLEETDYLVKYKRFCVPKHDVAHAA